MKYEVGDTVLLLHSNEEGRIVEIMNENMVMVNVEGVEFPVFTDQIDFPYFKRFSEQSRNKATAPPPKTYIDQIPKEKVVAKGKKPDNGVQFMFIPVYDATQLEDNVDHFKLHLVNQNNEPYHFEYSVQYRYDPDFVITNTVPSQNDFYLHNLPLETLNDILKFQFHFSLTLPDKKKAEQIEKTIKVKAKTLFQKIEEMHKKNEPSFVFELFHQYPDKPAEEYFPVPEQKIIRPLKKQTLTENARSVIDIHIEKITDSYYGLSNFEILQIQLDYFEKYYRLAVLNMQPKLIVIHGVGSGKLRNEIHERLRTKKEVRSFVNQYHPDFGFGATEIYFQY